MSERRSQIYREKSLKTIESPESMHDYLQVTSPGVWLVLGAVIALLVGAVVWGIFGSIDTVRTIAVVASEDGAYCVIPYDCMEIAAKQAEITIDDAAYMIEAQAAQPETVTDKTNIYARLIGGYNLGDTVFIVPMDADLENGVYEGTLLTERIKPISLLLQ